MPKRFFSRLYHACWYFAAVLILSVAVAVTLMRYYLPDINNYNNEITEWINNRTGLDVKIKNIRASWEGWTAHIYLEDIRAFDKSGMKSSSLEKATINFNPFFILFDRGMSKLNIAVTGFDLVVVRNRDGSFNITSGQQNGDELTEEPAGLVLWLLSQKSIAIEDTSVAYIDKTGSYPDLSFPDVDLLLRTTKDHMQVNGSAVLPGEYGKTLAFAIDLLGDFTTSSWSGKIYIAGKNIYPDQWRSFYNNTIKSLEITSGPADIELWSTWENATLTGINGRIDTGSVSIKYDNLSEDVDNLTASFAIKPDGGRFQANVLIEQLVTDRKTWPETRILVQREPDPAGSGYIYYASSSYLNIEDITPALTVFSNIKALIDEYQVEVKGELLDSYITLAPEYPEYSWFSTTTRALEVAVGEDAFSLDGISAEFLATATNGEIRFNPSPVTFILPVQFDAPILLNRIEGNIKWLKTREGPWQITTDSLLVETEHLDAYIFGGMIINPEISEVDSDLLFGVSNVNLEYVSKYLPKVVNKDVRAWINRSVISGKLASMDFILRGNPVDFPFNNNAGRFQAIANVSNLTLEYDPEWLPADRVVAELLIDNEKLTIHSNSGYIYNAGFSDIQAVVNDINNPESSIQITGHLDSDVQQGLFILKNSPLSTSGQLEKIYDFDLEGPISLDLDLDIPFNEKKMSVDGLLQLDKLTLNSPLTGIHLEDLSGDISFTRHEFTSGNLTALFMGEPVTLQVSVADNYPLNFGMTGKADEIYIKNLLNHYFPDLGELFGKLLPNISGTTRWTANMSSEVQADDGSPQKQILTISSDLEGLELDFPEPLKKGAEPSSLDINITLVDNSLETIQINYGEIIADFKDNQIDGVDAPHDEYLPENLPASTRSRGLQITGRADFFPLQVWQEFLFKLDSAFPDKKITRIFINLNFDLITCFGQSFTDTVFSLENIPSGWLVALSGDDIDGNLAIPMDNTNDKVIGSFNKLFLSPVDSNNDKISTLPQDVPAFRITSSAFKYNGYDLGNVSIDTSKSQDGMNIDSILVSKPDLSISGNGTWNLINNNEKSDFIFKLEAGNFDTMLKTFGYTVQPIRKGNTWITADVTWPGSPVDITVENLKGSVSLIIKDGTLIDVDPSTGRLFGLLGLQTIPRRVTLDFSDLFSKGLVFDRIGGHYSIENGDAYTNDFTMRGPSIDVAMSGRTGLVKKDYDQIVTVSPKVTGNLPIAGALFGPVGIGIGTTIFLAGEVFESIPKQIGKILRVQYTMKGSWNNPVLERYKIEAAEESGPRKNIK